MISETLQKTVLDNRILDYLLFLAYISAGIIGVKIIKSLIVSRLKAWSQKTANTVDDFLLTIFKKNLVPLLYLGVLYISLKSLKVSSAISSIVNIASIVILTVAGLRLIMSLMDYSLDIYWAKKEVDVTRQKNLKGIITVLKVLVWGAGITFLLDNLGFKISTVVAGLGIGGIAVALAAQTILGDLFSYFIIFFDRPFEIGDFIIIGEYMGSIEHIGIKTTRVRSLGGEQLVFSNTDLTSSRIRNYKRMEKRRVVFRLGVTYQTSLSDIKAIPALIKDVITSINDTVFDRAHFAAYGDFSLNIEVVYYVMSSDYNKYMDVQQEINLHIKEEFEKRGIEFAYPTQTLIVEKTEENH